MFQPVLLKVISWNACGPPRIRNCPGLSDALAPYGSLIVLVEYTTGEVSLLCTPAKVYFQNLFNFGT